MMVVLEAGEKLPNPVRNRLLIVEDETMMAFMLEEMLTGLGYIVVKIAANMESAFSSIEQYTFDAVILDVNLNGDTTFRLADKLAQKRIPFVFSTGYNQLSLPEKYQQQLLLQKPFTIAQLGSQVKHLLDGAD